jgi:hypothetical protein
MVGVRWDEAEDGVQAEEGRGERRNRKADVRLELPQKRGHCHSRRRCNFLTIFL